MIALGIDAAWTATEPSGVALLRRVAKKWECVALAPSYASFIGLAAGQPVDWSVKPVASSPDPGALLVAAAVLAEGSVDVVAVDMPLATTPICERRVSDNAVSSAFGANGCSVHSPSATRPGAMSDRFREQLGVIGFSLACASTRVGTKPALLEVFPHIALLELLGATYRVPYKISKSTRYWPEASKEERRKLLRREWRKIIAALAARIGGWSLAIPTGATFARMKRYEDAIDALLCAWVATEYLAGRCRAYGDAVSAIWNVS